MISDLRKKALEVSDLKLDHRFSSWVKWVDGVDTTKSNGWAFIGEFVPDGTIEFEPRSAVLLCAAVSGSAKYHHTYYRVITMTPDGELHPTDIIDSDEKRGWALRMRDDVSNLLADLLNEPTPNPLVDFSDSDLIDELNRRGIEWTK
jgi:hypothetical protein